MAFASVKFSTAICSRFFKSNIIQTLTSRVNADSKIGSRWRWLAQFLWQKSWHIFRLIFYSLWSKIICLRLVQFLLRQST